MHSFKKKCSTLFHSYQFSWLSVLFTLSLFIIKEFLHCVNYILWIKKVTTLNGGVAFTRITILTLYSIYAINLVYFFAKY